MVVLVIMAPATTFLIVVMVFVAATATLIIVMMVFMIVAAAVAFTFFMVMMVVTTATALTFHIIVVMTATAAFALIIVVMMAAATAAAAFVMVMVSTTATTAAARMGTRQRHGHERLVHHSALQAHAFQHLAEGVVGNDAEAVVGLRNANAAGDEGVDRLLHELMVARDMHHLVLRGFHDIESALFVNEHILHFEGAHVAQRVFIGLFTYREDGRRLHAVCVGKNHLLGASKKGMSRTGLQRQKLRDLHSGKLKAPEERGGARRKTLESRPKLRRTADRLILAKGLSRRARRPARRRAGQRR